MKKVKCDKRLGDSKRCENGEEEESRRAKKTSSKTSKQDEEQGRIPDTK